MSTHYNPFDKGGWDYGEKMPGYNEWHRYLGPCPHCGTACFDYGGGWRCLAMYCFNSANNPASTVGPIPDWWNTNIRVLKDGNAWMAHYDDFINPMESPAEFGNTPDEAVKKLKESVILSTTKPM